MAYRQIRVSDISGKELDDNEIVGVIVKGHPDLGGDRVFNDNPYSEAWFQTLKFAPIFPERFHSLGAPRNGRTTILVPQRTCCGTGCYLNGTPLRRISTCSYPL